MRRWHSVAAGLVALGALGAAPVFFAPKITGDPPKNQAGVAPDATGDQLERPDATEQLTASAARLLAPPATIPAPRFGSSTPSSVFPSRREALDRSSVIVETGTTDQQYRIDDPPVETTYDLRSLTSTAYPFGDSFPLAFGPDTPGTRTVVIGGTVLGQQDRDLTWEEVHDPYGGGGLRMIGTDYLVSYDLRVDNVNDGFMPLPPEGDLNAARFLIDGCHMTWIRDDAVEDDTEMSGTIRDCLFDGINTGVSIGQSTGNPNALVRIKHSTFLFAPMRNERAADGIGHQTLFKQMPGGRVRLSHVLICYPENPMSPSRLRIFPPGTYSRVEIVLGPDFVGRYPGRRPAGVTVSRDWSLCGAAKADWLSKHERKDRVAEG